MAKLYIKDPVDVLDYEVLWASRLENGETITDHSVAVSPSGELVVDDTLVSGDVVKIWVSGGNVGCYYSLDCTITTSGGRTYSQKIKLLVLDK